jgi:erythromycin esterase
MKYLYFTVFYCLLYWAVLAQDIKRYVAENTVRISNIDTLSNDYTDLESIGEAIGDARVVMLGEQDHGDAPAFLAKTRLIKYLHEKKGFNVLAFESDFYGLTKGWDEVSKQPDSIRQFLKGNIFPYWTRSDACRYLFENYILNSFQAKEPLHITGFDPQLYLDYSFGNLERDLNEYLVKNNLTTKFSADTAYQSFLDAVEGLTASGRKANAINKNMNRILQEGLEIIRKAQIENKDSSYWSVVIRNLIAFSNNSNETRDETMSENLKFLVDKKYKEEKIIVWAANTHIMKYTDQIRSGRRDFNQVIFKNMGTDFTKDPLLATKTYVLGFTSYKGTTGRLWSKPFPIEPPNKNGLENWIPEPTVYGFIDFKNYNNNFGNPKTPFLMKAPMHFTIQRNVAEIPWNLVYDGIFFIREMYPVKKAG